MKTKVSKRIWALVLTAVMLFGMLPQVTLHVHAMEQSGTASLDDARIGVAYTLYTNYMSLSNSDIDYAKFSAVGNTITASGKSRSQFSVKEYGVKITLTNTRSIPATLSFGYTVGIEGNGTVTIDGTKVTAGGSFSKVLAAGEKVTIEVKSGDKNKNQTTSISMTNITLASDAKSTVTFAPAVNGSYTVNGTQVKTNTTFTNSVEYKYQLAATPADGYSFVGWRIEKTGELISIKANDLISIDQDSTVTAVFLGTEENFQVGEMKFNDLGIAASYAKVAGINRVIQLKDTTVTSDCIIPEGVTLLVPYDADATAYGATAGATKTEETPTVYRKLTMGTGVTLTVNGNIEVGGRHLTSSGQYVCKPTGAYGQIILSQGSNIVLNSGANLYAWGYITGSGTVTANSGANVYEIFQITDWRGGQATQTLDDNEQKVFFFSQYYVQNVEAELMIKAGARLACYCTVTASGITNSATIVLAGNNGLFTIGEGGYFTKKYTPSTDRVEYRVGGNVTMKKILLKILLITVDSSAYVLPISNNVDIVVDGTVEITSDVALLPGSTVTINQGGAVQISSNLYVYDVDQWSNQYVYTGGNNGYVPVAYSPSGRGNRAALKDAKIDVNGELYAIGYLYTTSSGASIVSSEGTGMCYIAEPGTADKTYQITHKVGDNRPVITYIDIPINSAWLQNRDGSYVQTGNYGECTTFYYCPVSGKWTTTDEHNISVSYKWNDNFSECEATRKCSCGAKETAKASSKKQVVSNANCTQGEVYYWVTTGFGVDWAEEQKTENKSGNPLNHAYTKQDVKADCLASEADCTHAATYYYSCSRCGACEHNANHTFTNGKANGHKYGETTYEWNGQTCTATRKCTVTGCTHSEMAKAQTYTKNVTQTAACTQIEKYTLTATNFGVSWANSNTSETFNGSENPNNHVGGETPKLISGNDNQHSIVCAGCGVELREENHSYTNGVCACQHKKQYTITFVANGETVDTQTLTWGQIPTIPANPTKEPDAHYHYTFKTWGNVVAVTGNATYTAEFTPEAHVDTDKHDHYCDKCNYKLGDHKYDQTNTDSKYLASAATCTSRAKYYYSCSCGLSEKNDNRTFEAGELAPHVYGEVKYEWSEDHMKCDATRKCKCGDKQTASASTIKQTTKTEATCKTIGVDTFTAAFDVEWAKECSEDVEIGYNSSKHEGKLLYKDDENGKTHHSYYDGCGHTAEENLEHEYHDGKCACGAVQKFTITFIVNGQQTQVSVEYGKVPVYDNKFPLTKAYDDDYHYTFDGWDNEIVAAKENATYTAKFKGEAHEDADHDHFCDHESCKKRLSECKFDQNAIGEKYLYQVANCQHGNLYYCSCICGAFEKNDKNTFDDEQLDANNHAGILSDWKYNDEKHWMQWDCCPDVHENEADHIYVDGKCECGSKLNGWYTDAAGDTYYYIDGELQKGLTEIGGKLYALSEYDGKLFRGPGITTYGGSYYYIEEGIAVMGKGLVRMESMYCQEHDIVHTLYLYFPEGSYTAVANKNGYHITILNGLALPEANYNFTANGFIEHDADTTKNGISCATGTEKKFYFIDGVKIGLGLTKIGNDYYYIRTSNGEVVCDRNYFISQGNDLLKAGIYYFDQDGKLVISGWQEANGYTYYYISGIRQTGPVEIEGKIYFFNYGNGRLCKDQRVWVNDHKELNIVGGFYMTDANGVLQTVKNGFETNHVKWTDSTGFHEGDYTYYYVNGVLQKGLVKIGDDFYLFNASSGAMLTNGSYWVGDNAYGVEPGIYVANADGVLQIKKNGFETKYVKWTDSTGFHEGMYTYYYIDGVLQKGLVKIGNDFYLFNASSGAMFTNGRYWVNENETYGIKSGMYEIGADGKLVIG